MVSWFLGKSVKLLPPDALIFSSKYTKMRLAAGLRPDPLGSLSAPPNPLAAKRGLLLRVWGRKKGEGKGGEGKGGEGKGGERGEEGLAVEPSHFSTGSDASDDDELSRGGFV